ncbi:MAG: hypothetical protein ACREFQ_01960 [Stellaceae bacterium]
MAEDGIRDGDAGEQARRTGRRARHAAEGVASEAARVGEELREEARGFTEDIREAAQSLADEQKGRVADLAHGFAHALRRSADAFAEEGGTAVARYAGRMADQVEKLSETVRSESWGEMLANLEHATRRRPELFFVGAVAAGFFFGRMLTGGGAREAMES